MSKIFSFDTESFYSKDFTVQTLGAHKYAWDPRCDVYMISVDDGEKPWAGAPSEFDFSLFNGAVLVSHNAAFDQEIALAKMAQGIWPKFEPAEWHCTANMSSYLCNRRSLAEASSYLLGEKVSKGMRDYMKGKTWEEAVREGKAEEMLQYARDDARLCRELWVRFGHLWPEHERRLSWLTIEQGRRGVHIHRDRLEAGIQLLQRVELNAIDKLPWVKTGRAPASPHGVAEACRASGIPCPPVKAHDADGAAEWEEKYSASQPWIKALKDLRKAKKTLATLQTIKERLRPDGTLGFSLKYFGAHTGRWAGDAGINFQNFNREPIFVRDDYSLEDNRAVIDAKIKLFEENPDDPALNCLDVRGLLLPPPGMMIAAPDLSQIEPRGLSYLAGDDDLLNRIREGYPIYEAHARATMGWNGGKLKEENKKGYALAKARVLGLGYGCGWEKFITVAKIMAGLDITEDDMKVAMAQSIDGIVHTTYDGKSVAPYVWIKVQTREGEARERLNIFGANSKAIVKDYRDRNPKVVALWRTMQKALEDAVGDDLVIALPSGRKLTYRAVRCESRVQKDKETGLPYKKTVYTAEADGIRRIYYGSLIVENIVQAVSRDLFGENMLRILDAGIWPMWSVHDEAVCAVHNEEEAMTACKMMASCPDWFAGCPIASEATLSDRYKK